MSPVTHNDFFNKRLELSPVFRKQNQTDLSLRPARVTQRDTALKEKKKSGVAEETAQ